MSMITITFPDNSTIEVEKGLTLYEISKLYPHQETNIVGAEINNEVVPMDTIIGKNTTVNFIDMNIYNLTEAPTQNQIAEYLGKDKGQVSRALNSFKDFVQEQYAENGAKL